MKRFLRRALNPPRPHRFSPGRLLLVLAAARETLVRALSLGGSISGNQRGHVGSAKAVAQSDTTTPPESPAPDDVTSFFLLRHGQTNFNAIGRIQGTLDSSVLTDNGIAQAQEAGKILASRSDLEFGPTVLVSPMGRAQQTLACLREELKKCSKDFKSMEVVPDIREIELFEWEGELVEDIKVKWPEEFAAWKSDPCDFNIAGRYPARELWARASQAWEEIRSLQSIQDQKKTLVVAHNAINQALLWTALGCDTSYFRKLPWPNCAVLELQWRRGQERAERYRWIIPKPSPFVEAGDAIRLLKEGANDNQYTV